MDKVLIEKINNFFTVNIEKIKEGTYFPTYDKIKHLPEFNGISTAQFIVARDEWYKQTFHTNSNADSSRLAKTERQREYGKENNMGKKGTPMSPSDLINTFACPSSGNKGAVFLIKIVKDFILVKQSCPTLHPYGWTNKVRVFRIPIWLKDQCVSYFRDTVFRCFECGHEAKVEYVKFSGPWALIRLSCPTHGNTRPYHKIWGTVYSEISNEGITIPQQIKIRPIPSEENRFCSKCGKKFIEVSQKFCHNCGSERLM